LSVWLYNLIILFNPEEIIFGGGIGQNVLPPLLPALEEKVRTLLHERKFAHIVCLRSARLENAGSVGAAVYAGRIVF
ncbi:MAG: ROK family protein, partial [bacterium]